MKYDRREPCSNCPFRRSAVLAYWHPTMYEMLASIEKGEHDFWTARVFGCHKDRHFPPDQREHCVGWLLHQRENGVPNLALRLLLVTTPAAFTQFEESSIADGELYDTVGEIVQANLARDRELNPDRYE